MFHKTVKKIMSLRKKKSQTTLDENVTIHDYPGDANPDESDTSRVFRHAFISKFENFKNEADLLADGNANFNDTWKDTIGKEGLAVTVIVVAGTIAVLGAVSVLSAAVSAGIAIPVAVIGVVAGVAFYKYREHIKKGRFQSAAAIMDRDDLSQNIHDIARLLAELYQLQLASCTIKDAHVLAEGCVNAICADMLKNGKFNFNELLYASSLQGVLMRSLSKVPKTTLDMNIITNQKFNARGLISHSAYYCRETDEFYQSSKTKSTKYGVLFFDKKEDLEDYESILTATMKGGEKWKFSKMRPHEVNVLMRSTMFKTYKNDKLFEGKKPVELVENKERVKVT